MKLSIRLFGVATLLGLIFGVLFGYSALSDSFTAFLARRVPPSFLEFASASGVPASRTGLVTRCVISWTLHWWSVAICVPGFAWLLQRFPLAGESWPRGVWPHLGAGLVFAAGLSALDNVLIPIVVARIDPALLVQYWTKHDLRPVVAYAWSYMFHRAFLTYVVVLSILQAVSWYGRYKQDELTAARVEAALAAVELKGLRTQMRGEFLIAALGDIRRLARYDPSAADRLLNRLSDALRLMLQHANAFDTSLADALDFLAVYLDVGRLRASSQQVALELAIPPDTLDARVPQLLLATLIEGIRPSPGVDMVRVTARRNEQTLELEIGVEGDDGENSLNEVRARVERFYPGQHDIELRGHAMPAFVIRLPIDAGLAKPVIPETETCLAHSHCR
jgi:hypothetical protein